MPHLKKFLLATESKKEKKKKKFGVRVGEKGEQVY